METTDVTEAAEPQPKAGKDAFHRVPNISGANKRDAVERVLTENLRGNGKISRDSRILRPTGPSSSPL